MLFCQEDGMFQYMITRIKFHFLWVKSTHLNPSSEELLRLTDKLIGPDLNDHRSRRKGKKGKRGWNDGVRVLSGSHCWLDVAMIHDFI